MGAKSSHDTCDPDARRRVCGPPAATVVASHGSHSTRITIAITITQQQHAQQQQHAHWQQQSVVNNSLLHAMHDYLRPTGTSRGTYFNTGGS